VAVSAGELVTQCFVFCVDAVNLVSEESDFIELRGLPFLLPQERDGLLLVVAETLQVGEILFGIGRQFGAALFEAAFVNFEQLFPLRYAFVY
jgi:hypothetical protein